jgi:putative heme-binding domain-containing protein
LLHIVPGGDYGYRFRNGRKGLHPFTAWNGELPGTLPMVAGTGEAPSGIVAYESNGLPPEYVGDLIATSWGDHVIQRFKLHERGASFTSQAETLIRGDDNFYPVGIATAPDGSLVVTDWADKAYPVHGKGRVWRIRMKEPPGDDGLRSSNVRKLRDTDHLLELLQHPKQEIRHAAGHALASAAESSNDAAKLIDKLQKEVSAAEHDVDSRAAMHALWSLARSANAQRSLMSTLSCNRSEVRAESARIVGELIRLGTSELERYLIDLLSDEHESSPFVRLQTILGIQSDQGLEKLSPFLASDDPFLRGAAIETLGRSANLDLLLPLRNHESLGMRVGALLALRRSGQQGAREALVDFLRDADPEVRRAAIQWVGEEHLNDFAPRLQDAILVVPLTRSVFEAFLAAKDSLAGIVRNPTDELSGEDFIAKIFGDESQPMALRALAIRSLRPDHPVLATAKLEGLIGSGDATLCIEAVHTLASRSDSASQQVLRRIARDEQADATTRTEAVLGLGHSAGANDDTARVLIDLLSSSNSEIRHESLRSLRGGARRQDVISAIRKRLQQPDGFASADERDLAEMVLRARPGDESSNRTREWAAEIERLVKEPGDRAAGERVFFHPNGPQCFACHRVNGRGGAVGPDLSVIGQTLDRSKIVRSILEPSKDIAPQFMPWLFALRDGRVVSGIILLDDPGGVISVGDSEGKTIEIAKGDIVDRKALDRSIMPDNIADRMTRGEFRDLIAFLLALR